MNTFGKVIFSQGEYLGEVLNGKAHGYGRINFNNGDKYIGQWSNNCMSGIGFIDTKSYRTLGQFFNGKRHGNCLTIYKKGLTEFDFYIGKYENDLKCGKGAYLWENEDCYYGDFANNRPNGKGFISRFGGDSFFGGTYKDSKCIDGGVDFPKTKLPSGCTFYGDCNKYDFYSGFGLLVSQHNKVRELGYHNKLGPNMRISYNFKGVRIGGNKIRCGSFSKYLEVGDWGTSIGKLNGKFDKIYDNGTMYSGNYIDGKKNGYGVYYDGGITSRGLGSLMIGTFSSGKLVNGVEIGSDFLVLSNGKFSSSSEEGFKLYNTGELMTFNYKGKFSQMINFPVFNGVLNDVCSISNNLCQNNNNLNQYQNISNNVNNFEDNEEDPPIIDFVKAEEKRKYLEKVAAEAKIWKKEQEEKLAKEKKEKEAQLAKEKKRKEIDENIKRLAIERLKETYYTDENANEIRVCKKKIEVKYHVIPEGITKLCKKSFAYQKTVETIVGPTTLKEIDELAFAFSPSIKEIDLSVTSITKLRSKCFVDCINLESLRLPDTIQEISISNFHNCHKLSKIIIGTKELSFNDFVDQYCSDKDKVFPKYYYYDEFNYYSSQGAFLTPKLYDFNTLLEANTGTREEIIISPRFNKILNNAFKRVKKYVKKIIILHPSIELEENALKGLTNLIELDLSETKITSLNGINLSHCTSLDTLRLPSTLDLEKSINEIANCESLKKIYHQEKIIFVKKDSMFNKRKNEKTEEKNVSNDAVQKKKVVSSKHKLLKVKDDNYTKNLKIIDLDHCDTKILPEESYKDYRELEKVILPKKLETISKGSFMNCFKLKDLNFDIKNSITIKESAFLSCISLEEVHLNTNSIGDKAFYNCKSLKKITIDCDSDEIKLGSEVFCYCYSLNELIAPKIKSFSNFEFFKCSQIKKIVVHRKCKIDKKFLKKMLTIDCKIKISKKGMTKIITIN